MASQKKKNKLKNSYGSYGVLKNKKDKCKRFLFYSSSQRKEFDFKIKEQIVSNLNDCELIYNDDLDCCRGWHSRDNLIRR